MTRIEQVGAADHVVELADAQLGHDAAHFFGNEEKVVHHMLGLAGELLAQHRVLRGHADRAGVEVAFAHHDAAFNHQRCRGKTKLVGTKQRADDDVAAGLHLTINLDPDAAAQAVQNQGLLGFRQPYFPGTAGVLDGRPGRSAGAAIVPGNHHMITLALGHARSDGADTDLADQLDADARMRRHIFEVVNQLRQVFDRVNVVVRRRRNQADARNRVAQATDVVRHLAARQLTAFTGLGTLRHLDLNLIGTAEVLGGHAKSARSDLLDARAQ